MSIRVALYLSLEQQSYRLHRTMKGLWLTPLNMAMLHIVEVKAILRMILKKSGNPSWPGDFPDWWNLNFRLFYRFLFIGYISERAWDIQRIKKVLHQSFLLWKLRGIKLRIERPGCVVTLTWSEVMVPLVVLFLGICSFAWIPFSWLDSILSALSMHIEQTLRSWH